MSVTNVCTLTETDVTTPNFHHLSLTQDIPAGVSLILAHLSSVDASDGGLTSAPSNIGGAAWVQDHVYHPGLDTSTVDVWRVNVVSPINHLTTTIDIPGTSRGLSTECVVYMVDAPGYVTLDQSHDANNNFTTDHNSGLTPAAAAVDLLLIGLHGMNQNTIAWTPEVVSPTWTAVVQGNATIGYASAIQHRIVVGGGGTYQSRGSTGASCTSNDAIVAYKAAASSQATGVGGVALGAIAVPDTRTGHELHVRARKANPAESGSFRMWLFESGVLRSGPWDVVLTDVFTNSRVALPDADVAKIGSYSNLELRFQGVGPAGAITPQVSFMELQTPGASAAAFGVSNFPAFEWPAKVSGPSAPMFRPGAIPRSTTDVSVPASGGSNLFQQALSAVVVVTASLQMQVGKALTATAVVVSGSLQKQVSKAMSATSAASATLQRQTNKGMSATSAVTATMQRQVNKTLSATAVVVTGSIQRQVNRAMSATVAVAASMQKQVNKSMTATAVVITGALAALKVILKSMSATVAVTATMSRQVGKNMSATVVATGSIAKLVGKRLSATSAVSASMTKLVAKRLTSSVAVTASLVAQFIAGGGVAIVRGFFDRSHKKGSQFDPPTEKSNEFDPPGPS